MAWSLLLVALIPVLTSADQYDDNKTGRGNDKFHCNRQCRWHYGFFERSIQGKTLSRNGNNICDCTKHGASLGTAPYYTTDHPLTGPPTVPNGVGVFDRACCKQGDDIPWGKCTEPTGNCHSNVYSWAKPFDPDYWADKYSTNWLCVRNLSATAVPPFSIQEPDDMHKACSKDTDPNADVVCRAGKAKIESSGLQILHCGRCSACSSVEDIEVLYKTRSYITTKMTQCSSKWVISQIMPFGAQTLMDLKQCLIGQGINFSDAGQAWKDATDKPSCMDTWTDNILNDADLCVNFCLTKFVPTKNTGNFAKDKCLQCDEYTSGPAFIKGAGANRRSTGIVSDIDRTQLAGTQWEQKICKVGYYSKLSSGAALIV